MVKKKALTKHKKSSLLLIFIYLHLTGLFAVVVLTVTVLYNFERAYNQKVYPGVRIDGVSFGGKTMEFVDQYFAQKSIPFKQLNITLIFEDKIATLSGDTLNVSFDGKLLSLQAYLIARSGNILSDTYQKWRAVSAGINLPGVWRMNHDILNETVEQLSASIDILPQDALFQFANGKVTIFKPSKSGRQLDTNKTKEMVNAYISALTNSDPINPQSTVISLPVEIVESSVSTENSNSFGIKELIGAGRSKFVGSIPGRVHNIALAASRIHGRLIAPGAVFSFNEALGDVSAATGFQPAYIIKSGRTVLGDGGGVCQVSTTFFRAALNAGLPIVERHAHSYRVGYYEQDSPPGFDATVFAPSYDLKIKNNTENYILIQAKTDTKNYTLAFEFYGTSDGRSVEIGKASAWGQTAPPPDLYQDDPTLKTGVVKQVDWKAWGAKTNFDYKVVRNGEIITQQSFFSNFQPWQAVFLRGTAP